MSAEICVKCFKNSCICESLETKTHEAVNEDDAMMNLHLKAISGSFKHEPLNLQLSKEDKAKLAERFTAVMRASYIFGYNQCKIDTKNIMDEHLKLF